jgi:O-antigen ligase
LHINAPGLNAMGTLERKWVWLIFPIVMAGSVQLNTKQVHLLFDLFCYSCLGAMLYCEGIAAYHYYLQPSNFHHLIYELLAYPIMHPGYLSNYYLLAILWLVLPFLNKNYGTQMPAWRRNILLFLFIIFIAQLTSKTAFIIIIIYGIWLSIQFVLSNKTMIQKIKFVVFAFLIFASMVFFVRVVLWARFQEMFTVAPITNKILFCESVNSRRAAAIEAYNKLSPVWYKGYGTGTANEKLLEQLTEKNYTDLVLHDMHTHNQYMHTCLDIGVFGLALILIIFIGSLFIFIKQKNKMGIGIIIITLVNCLTDDMLEIQAGLVFFMFFISLGLFGFTKKFIE